MPSIIYSSTLIQVTDHHHVKVTQPRGAGTWLPSWHVQMTRIIYHQTSDDRMVVVSTTERLILSLQLTDGSGSPCRLANDGVYMGPAGRLSRWSTQPPV